MHINYHQKFILTSLIIIILKKGFVQSLTISPRRKEIKLISLPHASSSASSQGLINQLWRWKDECLGDGRDFFVPRPRAIAALNRCLLHNNRSNEDDGCDWRVEEAAVLSNCARLDVLLLLVDCCNHNDGNLRSIIQDSAEDPQNNEVVSNKLAADIVAKVLLTQLDSYKGSKKHTILQSSGLGSLLDLPGMIDDNPDNAVNNNINNNDVEALAQALDVQGDEREIIRHYCLIASGMAPRVNRPDRAVVFRPFSSRDAHIMLQIKRTKEYALGSTLKLLFDTALQAGKDARNPQIISELEPLKGLGDSHDYPPTPTDTAAKAVFSKVIEPTMARFSRKLKSMGQAEQIKEFRFQIKEFSRELGIDINDVQDPRVKNIKKIIHQPLIDLRDGNNIDRAAIQLEIQKMV